MRKSQDKGTVWQLNSQYLPPLLVTVPDAMTNCDILRWSTKYDLCIHRMKYIISGVFFCAESDSGFCFFPARQVFEIC